MKVTLFHHKSPSWRGFPSNLLPGEVVPTIKLDAKFPSPIGSQTEPVQTFREGITEYVSNQISPTVLPVSPPNVGELLGAAAPTKQEPTFERLSFAVRK